MSELDVSIKAKRKQLVIGTFVVIGILGVSFIGVSMIDDKKPREIKADALPKTNIKSAGDAVKPEDEWQSQAGADVKALKLYNEELEKRIKTLEQEKKGEKKEGPSTFPPAPLPNGKSAPLPPGPPPPLQQAAPQGFGNASAAKDEPKRKAIFSMEIGDAAIPATNKSADGIDEKAAPIRNIKSYIPSGAFMRSVMLGGLDAPTGGQSQNNPHPVLFRIVDLAILPNQFRHNVKECFATGAGYGDISSERAYIKIENLSCVKRNGNVMDVPVKGNAYVAGEDGKTGMRGRLVTKQGQILANALLAGVVSGLGQGMVNASTTTSVSPLGSTTTVDQGKELQNGVYTGVGKAMDRLAQYYINMAEKIFPVIEVDAGRQVDIILTQGLDLERFMPKEEDRGGSYWKRGRDHEGKPYEPYKN